MVVNTLPPTDISGVGEQVMQLTTGLRQGGVDVEILGRGPGGVHGPKVLFPIMALVPALRALRRFRPNVVQVHESDGALVALLVAVLRPLLASEPKIVALLQVSYWREFLSVKSILSGSSRPAHPSWEEARFRWCKAPLQLILGWLVTLVSDQVIAPSQATASELAQDYGAEQVEVLPNAMGHKELVGVPVPGIPEQGNFLLFVGRLRIRKGVDILLEAINLLQGVSRAGVLVVAGDGEHKRALENRARRLGIESRIVFAGRCSAGQVQYLLDKAKALVVPSLYEGMPLVILEAMENSLPVVASRVSGIPEIVVDGETGWLTEPGSIEELASVLTVVLSGSNEPRRRGQLGRERLEAAYRPRHAARLWLEIVAPNG